MLLQASLSNFGAATLRPKKATIGRIGASSTLTNKSMPIISATHPCADPAQLRIHMAQQGKPYLADYPEVAFNLSHTADKMAVAMAYNCDLGIDIEQCKARTNLAALVEKCFGEEEIGHWENLPDSLKMEEFYRFWTRKEAFVKATGIGIALGLKQCVINPGNPACLLRIPQAVGYPSEWQILDLPLGRPIYGAVAIKSPDKLRVELVAF
jgi:4'-phosphopantetheinyl transferase